MIENLEENRCLSTWMCSAGHVGITYGGGVPEACQLDGEEGSVVECAPLERLRRVEYCYKQLAGSCLPLDEGRGEGVSV